MIKQLVLLFSITKLLTIGAQDTLSSFSYFNKVYGGDTSNWGSRIGLETERGYLTVGFLGDGNNRDLNLRSLNEAGELEEIYPFSIQPDFTNCYDGASTWQVNDSTFLFINCFFKNPANSQDLDIYFVRGNSKGDILVSTVIADSPGRERPNAIVPTSDGNFLVVGTYQESPSVDTKFYLAKINPFGFKIWENNSIGGDPGGISAAFSAVQLDNGNYLIGGGAYFEGKDYDKTLLEIDWNGQLVNLTHFGGDGADCGAQLVPNSEGNIFVSSCHRDGNENSPPVYYGMLNQELDAIWETVSYELDVTSFVTRPIPTGLNSFIGVVSYSNEDNWDQNAILEIGYEGEVLLFKPITPNPEKHVYVHDMRPTKDGGYLITGYEHFPSPNRSWVLKVDSLGNYCQLGTDSTVYVIDTTTGIGILNDSFIEKEIRISPNPASDWIWIKINERISTVRIFDLNGRLLAEENEPSFSVSALPAGICLVEVLSKSGGIYREKLLVENQ